MYNILVEVSYLIPMYTSIATPDGDGERRKEGKKA